MLSWIAIGVLVWLYLQRNHRIDALEQRMKKLEQELNLLRIGGTAKPASAGVPFPPALRPTEAAAGETAVDTTAPGPQPAASAPVAPPFGSPLPSRPLAATATTAASASMAATAPAVPAAPRTQPAQAARPAPASPAPQPPSPWAQATDSLLGLVRKNPFASLGVLLMLVGIGFLFSLLAASNILPPAARVLLLAAAGVAVFFVGLRQEPRREGLALNLQGGAIALEFLCVLWSYHGYQLITPTTAFALLGGLSTLSVGWATLKRRSLFVLIGLAGALGTPLFASTGQGNFANLALYGAWVSVLGLGSALRLGAPFLASAALAGLSLLLWAAARTIAQGAAEVTVATLTALTVAYCGAALFWTRSCEALSAKARASVVALLVGTPLVMAGLLHEAADVDSRWCALLVGIAAVADLLAMARASAVWRPSLLAIGAALGLVAIGVGLDGPSRALALSGSALGLVLMARAHEKSWAGWAALVYWIGSVLMGLMELQTNAALHAWPLGVSGAVALAAGYLLRGEPLGPVYTFSAPLVLGLAVLHPHLDDPVAIVCWGLGWAAAAVVVSRVMDWRTLLLSAAWLLPCGLPLFADRLPYAWTGTDLALRELLLLAWVTGSAALVWTWRLEAGVLALLALAPPALATLELFHTLPRTGVSEETIRLAALLLWSGWTLLLGFARMDLKPAISGAIAAGWLVLALLLAAPGIGTELAQWLSLVLLWRAMLRSGEAWRWRPTLATLAGAALLGTALRAVGAVGYDLDLGAGRLVFLRVMQPWVSVFWAATGIALVAYASRAEHRRLWTIGSAVIAVLLAKMLLVDLATFNLGAKVAVFMLTGLGFVALGYFCPLPPQTEDEDAQATA